MFFLHFIPDSYLQLFIDGVLGLGAVLFLISTILSGLFKRWFPAVEAYMILVHILALVLLAGGAFFKGGYETELLWRHKAEEIQAKVDKAEQESKLANNKLDKKAKQKEKVIIVRQGVNKEYIQREVAKYNKSCVIPPEFVKAHNDAAEAPK